MKDDNEFIINDEENLAEIDEASQHRFPVKTQLFIIAVFLLFLFAGIVIPKSLALLDRQPPSTAVAANSNPAAAIDTFSQKDFSDVKIYADAAYVYDVNSDTVLFAKNADEALPLASITKLMTTLVAYELVPDNTPVTISPAAANQESGGGLTAGETFAVKELADFALVSSYNSAAYTLAAAVGQKLGPADPVEQFVAAMNIRADELGLDSLSYKNPTGLDETATQSGADGSARDVSLLMAFILENHPEILIPSVAPYTRLYNKQGDFHDAENTNNIIGEIPNLLGSKTGYTDLAGGNLTIAFDAGYNRPIIVTVLGSTRNERFADVKKLVATVLSNQSE